MTVCLCLAAIVFAAVGVWWAAALALGAAVVVGTIDFAEQRRRHQQVSVPRWRQIGRYADDHAVEPTLRDGDRSGE